MTCCSLRRACVRAGDTYCFPDGTRCGRRMGLCCPTTPLDARCHRGGPGGRGPYGISDTDVARALAPASRTFELMVATLLGNWTPFAQLMVTRDDNMSDVPVAFDPVLNPLPGLPLSQPFRSLREPAYRAARQARRDQARGA